MSFVSVTQQFNTTFSMGHCPSLSFAQFEWEVTAERIRDKIADGLVTVLMQVNRLPDEIREEIEAGYGFPASDAPVGASSAHSRQ